MSNLVSIIIPVYNQEPYLKECLNSIDNQTYKNIEVIIVDDGSTDNSHLVIYRHIINKENYTYYYTSNKGVSNARNYGLSKVKGTYFMFLDADDYLENDAIETLVNNMNKDIDIVIGSYNEIKEKKVKNIYKNRYLPMLRYQKDLIVYNYDNAVWGKLYKTQKIRKYRFDPNIKVGEDLLYLLSFDIRINVKIVSSSIYNYRFNINSAMNNDIVKKRIELIKYLEDYQNKYLLLKDYIISRIYKEARVCLLDYNDHFNNKSEFEYLCKILDKYRKHIINDKKEKFKNKFFALFQDSIIYYLKRKWLIKN